MNHTIHIRAPFECLAGCTWLARLTDKVRLMRRGELPADYLILLGHPQGVDGYFLRHFGLDRKSALEAISNQADDSDVAQWFLAQAGVTEASVQSWNDLAPNLGRRGWPGEKELAIAIERFYGGSIGEASVETVFELIHIDEKRSEKMR
jgi:hypothetical protein